MDVEFETYHRCCRCQCDLPYSCFHRQSGAKSGLYPQCKDCRSKSLRVIRAKNGRRADHLMNLYGITRACYFLMLSKQNGGCKICGATSSVRAGKEMNLAVDHDHETGEIRGLLCDLCNRGLGLFRDDDELLRKAADYLGSSRKER